MPATPTRHKFHESQQQRAAMIAAAEAYLATPAPAIRPVPQVIPFAIAAARLNSFEVLTTIQWQTDRAKKEIFAALPLEPNGWRFNESILSFVRCDPRGSVWRLTKYFGVNSSVRP